MEKSGTLGAACNDQTIFCMATQQGGAEIRSDNIAPTLTASAGMSGNNQPVICIQGNAIDRADTAGCNGKGWTEDVCYTLNTVDRPAVLTERTLRVSYRKQAHPKTSEDSQGWGETDLADTLNVFDNTEKRTPILIVEYAVTPEFVAAFKARAGGKAGGIAYDVCKCPTLLGSNDIGIVELDRAALNQGANARFDMGISEDGKTHTLTERPSAVCYAIGNGQAAGAGLHDKVESLNCMHDAQAVIVAVDARNGTESGANGALQSNACHSLNCNNTVRIRHIVRRLTPLECERLQGYPDGWTDIGAWTDSKSKVHQESTDSARYKALGNSIALPPWKWVLKRLCACYERDATMASLFDGIGGFPLLWEQLNGKGSCLWASEIEEFPIAVTKERIGD